MTLMSEVLPEPECPNSAMNRPAGGEFRVERKAAEPVGDVDLDHGACMQAAARLAREKLREQQRGH